MEFNSIAEAREYLQGRARKYNDEDSNGTPETLREMMSDIKKGYLTLDSVTARIEKA